MTGSFVTLVAGICNVMFSDTNGGFANFAFFMLNTAVLLTDFAADIESTVGGRLVAIHSYTRDKISDHSFTRDKASGHSYTSDNNPTNASGAIFCCNLTTSCEENNETTNKFGY
jgi:hypothetical protein